MIVDADWRHSPRVCLAVIMGASLALWAAVWVLSLTAMPLIGQLELN